MWRMRAGPHNQFQMLLNKLFRIIWTVYIYTLHGGEFVRETCRKTHPHPKTILNWSDYVEGSIIMNINRNKANYLLLALIYLVCVLLRSAQRNSQLSLSSCLHKIYALFQERLAGDALKTITVLIPPHQKYSYLPFNTSTAQRPPKRPFKRVDIFICTSQVVVLQVFDCIQ